MSEQQAAMGTRTTTPAAVVARPRASADAFRNLTARLRKPDLAVPTVSAAPIVVPLVETIPTPAPTVHVAAQVVTPPVVAAPLPVAPIVVEQVQPAPAVEVVAAAVAVQEEAEDYNVWDDLDPVMPAPVAAAPQPVQVVAEPAPIVEESAIAPVVAAPASEPVVEEQAVASVAIMPEPIAQVQVEAESVAGAEQAEHALQGSFADNFTYVPESGDQAGNTPAQPKLEDQHIDHAALEQALKEEVASRAEQLELENIWRMLLAKPTSDDRVQFLKEAAALSKEEIEALAPMAEHDLSRIAPAIVEEDQTPIVIDPHVDADAPTALATTILPLPEGQDVAELARSLLDMMASGSASGLPQERALAADTLLRIVPRLELKPLIMLSERLAMMDNPPHLLVSRLIRDSRVEVAGPLLENCPHLSDRDLEGVVQEGEPAKLRMIARRRKLTRAISDVLVKSGDPSVVLTLVRNKEAEISHDGFQSLLVLCENNEELMAPMATRQDMSPPFAFQLFWLAPAQLRRFILSRFLTDSETLTKILKITLSTQSDEEAEPLSQHALIESLERAARGHLDVASEELAAIMQVAPATILQILNDVQGDALVIMLKAAGYPRSAVSGMLKRMQDATLPLVSRDRDIGDLQIMFETLSFNKARILLTYWDWAQAKTGPYAPAQ
jgi:uncharacterized protein (DUF2336 family)